MYTMKRTMRSVIAVSAAIGVIAASMLLAMSSILNAHPGAVHAAGISGVTDYHVPGGNPWGTAFTSAGRVWVAMPGCDLAPTCSGSTPPGKLALFDPNSHRVVITVSLPAGYGQPAFVAVDSTDRVWFTMPVTNSIGLYNPVSKTVTQWPVPTASSGPWGITIDAKGIIWFTEHYGNQIASFNPTTHTFQEIATPATNSQPYGITVDTAGNIWFTENTDVVALIGEYTTQGVLKEYKIRNSKTGGTGLTPHLITIDPSGNIWWSEGWVSSIGTLKLASAQPGTNNGVTEYAYTPSCHNCGSHTSGIHADQQGVIWLDDSLQNVFGSFTVNGGFSFYNSPGNHPHDGLNVDAQGRVWFDEEFSNKLAVAIPSGLSTPTPTSTATNTATVTATSSATVPPGATLGSDTFQRANQTYWGVASDGQSWSGDANVQKAFSISATSGHVSNTGGASYNAVLGPQATNSEVYATGSISSFSNSNFGDVLRWTDTNDWYKAYIDGTNLVIQKKVSGTTTTLKSIRFAASAGTSYTIHFRVVGSTLTANVWAAAGTEPSGWMVTTSESTLASGHAGLRLLTQAGTATISSFLADVPGSGTATATPTSTATTTPTSTATVTPTLTATSTATLTPTSTATIAPGTPLGTDTFQRANHALWGTASDGQSWGGDANIVKAFSISGNSGHVTNTGGTSYSAVLGPQAANAEVYATGSISSFSNSNFGDVLRWTDGNNWYKAYIDGTSLVIQKKVSGTTTTLKSIRFAATAGTSYTIHFRVVGSTLSVNVWATSGTEPTGWMLAASDSALTSGYAGMRILTQNGLATVTSFQAKSL